MRGIFVSYRRSDTIDISARISDHLKSHFGSERVFIDFSNIIPGMAFAEHIKSRIRNANIVIAVIGHEWTPNRTALKEPENGDWVEFELRSALQAKIPIIPVLVHGARMPRSATLPVSLQKLPELHAMEISSNSNFDRNISDLIGVIENTIASDALSASHKPVVKVKKTDTLERILQLIRENDFSQFPVVDEMSFLGLLTENGITQWLANQFSDDNEIEISSRTIEVGDVIDFQGNAPNYSFFPGLGKIQDAIQMFHNQPALEALLLTDSGTMDSDIQGIITQWDAIEFGRPIGEDVIT
ncbi:MAG: TIR domain-containing protein [Verrucomicrobiales bacterium]|nr:TIR domain-containing protein [Verrucomicrobiales bacterium]